MSESQMPHTIKISSAHGVQQPARATLVVDKPQPPEAAPAGSPESESHDAVAADPIPLDANADLEAVLGAWHTATLRLEQTHNSLREEVRRLTDELEVKNRELMSRPSYSAIWPWRWGSLGRRRRSPATATV